MILCDTNILIEIYRNNPDIIEVVRKVGSENIAVSDVTRAELFFGARNKSELKAIKGDFDQLTILLIEKEISHIAVNLVEQYSLSHKLSFPDALIAATSIFYEIDLFTLNVKDFRFLGDIKLFDY